MSYTLNLKLEKFMLKYYNKQKRETTYDNISTFLGKFNDPKDEYEMSYDKYLCRMSSYPWIVSLGANFLSFFAVLTSIIITLVPSKRFPEKPGIPLLLEKHYSVQYHDILPKELSSNKEGFVAIDYCNKKFGPLSKESKKVFFRCIKRYPFRFFFLYLTYKELVAHSYFILNYNPEKVAVYVNERNPALPILTKLYEDNHRKLISFMHGEYNLQLVQSFMSFSEYYIWDDKYISMMQDVLRCNIKKYVVYTPDKETKKWHLENVIPDYDFTYYFSMEESEEAVKKIFDLLHTLGNRGYKCKCRVHPRNTVNLQIVEKYADSFYIEYPKEVPLEKSLGGTRYAIGLGTTVLFDAITEGREVVIDDISDPFRFKNLKELGNRSFDMDYVLLSSLISEGK